RSTSWQTGGTCLTLPAVRVRMQRLLEGAAASGGFCRTADLPKTPRSSPPASWAHRGCARLAVLLAPATKKEPTLPGTFQPPEDETMLRNRPIARTRWIIVA